MYNTGSAKYCTTFFTHTNCVLGIQNNSENNYVSTNVFCVKLYDVLKRLPFGI